MNYELKELIDSYDEEELKILITNNTVKKLYGKKQYVDFGLGCYYEAYIHSYTQTNDGSFFIFVKNKEDIDKPYGELTHRLNCLLNYVYEEKQPFMKHLCN